jgi:putative FmdB family regulatory protein
MPTYDYECTACSHSFELFQSITKGPIKKCPSCGKLKAKRLIGTGSTIIFKGSGFYQTDYKSTEYKSRQKAERLSSS